jgi:hypothetical protein
LVAGLDHDAASQLEQARPLHRDSHVPHPRQQVAPKLEAGLRFELLFDGGRSKTHAGKPSDQLLQRLAQFGDPDRRRRPGREVGEQSRLGGGLEELLGGLV